jgi:hypothetical protein
MSDFLERVVADTQVVLAALQQPEVKTDWETPTHRDVDPFDADYESLVLEPGLIPSVKAAVHKGFHVFGLTPKDKVTLPGSHGFKDSKAPSDPLVLEPWNQDPDRNIGIDLGASDLCVLDFDQGEDKIPSWVKDTRTLKVRTAKGLHVYFKGARRTTKLYVNGNLVGDVKSAGGYVLAAGSIHPDGPVYTVVDDSPIVPAPERIAELVRHDSEPVNASADGPPIPHGSHDTELTRIAGLLRNASFNGEDIAEHLIRVCERRCENHGPDYQDMCRKIAKSIGKKPVGQASGQLVFPDGEPAGLAAPETPPADWQDKFLSVGELEEGDVQMLITGFLPEGTTFIGGLPGEGKTLFALSIARALTTGKPFLGTFMVPKIVPVIYLIPESGGRAFRRRCERFEIPHDRTKFLCRTVSEGSTLPLDDLSLLEAVRRLKPVVILDTIIRFGEAQDENQAMQNKTLVDDVIRLRQAGAIAVIGLHHATKAMRKDGMSLETALRGTGDIAASADAVYGLLRDNMLYNNGEGPNEIDVACLKPRDFDPPNPFRIAATTRPVASRELVFGTESVIDNNHDFALISRGAQAQDVAQRIEQLVVETPTLTIKGLIEKTGRTEWEVRKALERLGYHRGKGGKKGTTQWTKAGLSTVPPPSDTGKDAVKPEYEADVSFDIPVAA